MAKKAWHEQTNIKKVEVDGIVFDSEIESRYYEILKAKKEAGEIISFSLQPKFTLLPKFEKFGKKHRAITYKADFKVIYPDSCEVVIDIKGFEPRTWPLTMKLFDARHPSIELIVLKECPKRYEEHSFDPGFIEAETLKRLQKEWKKNNPKKRGKK